MGRGTRKRLRDYYREHIHKLLEKGAEAVVDFIMDQHMALDALKKAIEKQRELNNELALKVKELEARLDEDSHNSHKPPSSDNPFAEPEEKTKSRRKKSGKKPGGQKGHTGHKLQPTDNPDNTIALTVEGTCECGRDLEHAEIIDHVIRQMFDIILPQLSSTEFCAEVRTCACGKIHKADFPDYLKGGVQYGPTIKSLAVYLKHHGMISYERLQELYTEVFGIPLSQGTLVNFINDCSGRLTPMVEEIKAGIIVSDVVHFDESGLRILGSLHWLHSASTSMLTYYFAHKKRGTEAMMEMGILPYFTGTAIHDHWESYYTYACTHGLCNAHHLRELIYFAEHGEKWAEKLMDCLIDAKNEKDESFILSEKRITYYKNRLKRILREGLHLHPKRLKTDKTRGRPKQTKQHNFLSRLNKKIDDVLRFIIDAAVPFDNNQGERDIRMLKVQQKVSGTFRSYSGAKSFCIIRGYISTIRKNKQPVFDAIQSAWSSRVTRPGALACAE